MYNLAGEYECKVDAKGRLRLPSGLLKQLGTEHARFTINRGFENHLMMYPQDVWEKKTNEINSLNIYVKKNRQAVRYFYRGATNVSCDSADRILIPKMLAKYAGLSKDVILFAYNEQIEIWDRKEYEQMLADEEPDQFSDLAEEVFGGKSDDGE